MSGRLLIRVDDERLANGGMLACEVSGGPRRSRKMISVQARADTAVTLRPGTYAVRAMLPSGQVLTAVTEVEDRGDTSLVLSTENIEGHDSASVAAREARLPMGRRAPSFQTHDDFVGDGDGISSGYGDGDESDSTSSGPFRTFGRGPRHRLPSLWARVWNGLQPSESSGEFRRLSAETAVFLPEDAFELASVQIGGPRVAWRFVCLPPYTACAVSVAKSMDRVGFDDGVSVSVSEPGDDATLLGYLASGQLDSAQAIAGPVVDKARTMFQQKAADPHGAAAAGYFLLRTGLQETLGEWPANFANWFSWLPDAQVIHAAQLLRRPHTPERQLARDRLVQASRSGVPRYTEGLRLLFQGLQLVAAEDAADAEVGQALTLVRSYATACDWNAIHTTYWAARPDEPSLEKRLGWPKDRSGWTRLRAS